ncbi:type IV secretion protein Rhs [Cronobacter dublinensis]|uniref:type IV secretion protein Rhs n=1 Tax=Cronobacter dublinensis TaxID=413497 RepID=UPI00376FB819
MKKENQGVQEGKLRLITAGEIAMAKRVYGNAITWSRVWIHYDSYLPFGLQNKFTAMAPNGEIWFREPFYRADYSVPQVDTLLKHTFIHELAHVWQHEHGMWVRMRGLFSWSADYHYRLDRSTLVEYSLEQQASIIADYWLLIVKGFGEWNFQRQNIPGRFCKYRGLDRPQDLIGLYEKIIYGRKRS